MDTTSISRRRFVSGTLGGCLALGATAVAQVADPVPAGRTAHNVLDYGAQGNGMTTDTRAIQAAIDTCHRGGGGTVLLPAGTFLSGSLHFKSHVALHLAHGSTLLASMDPADYDAPETLDFKNDADRETSFFHHALIWGEDVERIAVTGTGTIHCNRQKRGGPKTIALKRCRFVSIRDVSILNAPNYAISLLGTDYVGIDGVTILNGYADGIDPDCCHHVRIANCHIETRDDAIVPKTSFSLGQRRSTENLVVTNCLLATSCNAFKLGTESGGDFRNIAVSNCVISPLAGLRPPTSGIAILSVDGATIDGVAISNISMTGVRCPLFLRLGNRGRDMDTPTPGALRNVIISGIIANAATMPCALMGIPGHVIEGVTLKDLRLQFTGGSAPEQGRFDVPEQIAEYPDATKFANLPAYSLYCRHASDIHFSGIRLSCQKPELRPAIVCDDVSGLVIESVEATAGRESEALLSFRNVRDCLVRGCMPSDKTNVFLSVVGRESSGISLVANDFRRVKTPYKLGPDANLSPVLETANVR